MLWLLAGAQPARARVGAGRAGQREGMPHGDTSEQGPGPYWLYSALLTLVGPYPLHSLQVSSWEVQKKEQA